jgi:toxin YoeB
LEPKFKIEWSPESLRQVKIIKKNMVNVSAEKYFDKILRLINDIILHPFDGIGKPEHLKYKLPPCWSRRINSRDRLVYRVRRNKIQIVSILGHYEN